MIFDDLWILSAGFLAVMLVGISKGGFGGTTGVLATPLMALALPPTQAAAIMLPILCVMDVFAMRAYWGKADLQLVRSLALGGCLGIVSGVAAFKFFNVDQLRLLIGVMAVGFAVQNVLRELRQRTERRRPRPFTGSFWGGMAGFTSFVAHAGGPPLTIHLLALRLDKSVYQATTVFFFAMINFLKLGPYALLGLFNGETLIASATLAPLAPLGVWLGVLLHRRVNQSVFQWIITGGLFLTGIMLLV